MVAVIGGADNGSFFVPSGCSHFGALLLDFYFTENTGGFHAKKEWKALRSPLLRQHRTIKTAAPCAGSGRTAAVICGNFVS